MLVNEELMTRNVLSARTAEAPSPSAWTPVAVPVPAAQRASACNDAQEMVAFRVQVRIGGRVMDDQELDRYQYERCLHVLHELKYLGAEIRDGGQSLTHHDINWLLPDEAERVLFGTREELGACGTIHLLKGVLADSDRRWKRFNRTPIEEQGVWLGQTDFEVEGMDIAAIHALLNIEERHIGLMVMPEHYQFEGVMGSTKLRIVETLGMFGEPTDSDVRLGKQLPSFLPDTVRDPDFPLMVVAESFLRSDGSAAHFGVVHQLKPKRLGFQQRSIFFCPKNAPKAIAEGQTLHFALEFRNGLRHAHDRLGGMRLPASVDASQE